MRRLLLLLTLLLPVAAGAQLSVTPARDYDVNANALLSRADGFPSLPTVMATPPTFSVGASGGATTITNGQTLTYQGPNDPRFYQLGQTVAPDINQVYYPGGHSSGGGPGLGGNSASPWAIEFIWSTTAGEIEFGIRSGTQQLWINGQKATLRNSWTPVAADGTTYRLKASGIGIAPVAIASASVANPSVVTTSAPHGLASGQVIQIADVTGGTPTINGARLVTVTGADTFTVPVNVTVAPTPATGSVRRTSTHRIRLQMSGNTQLSLLTVGPHDTVVATPRRLETHGFMGDSFFEPTIADAAVTPCGDGPADIFAELAGINPRVGATGSTGWLDTNGVAGTDAVSRLPTILAMGVDRMWFALGINDNAGYTYAQVKAAALNAIALCKAAGLTRKNQIIFVAPFWPNPEVYVPVAMWNMHDAVRDAAAEGNVLFLDHLHTTPKAALTGTILTGTAANNDRVYSTLNLSGGVYLRIGNVGNVEVRRVHSSAVSGAGYYNYVNPFGNTTLAHTVGEAVSVVGPSWLTGTGTMAVPVNDGNKSRYITGPDPTHFTYAGYEDFGHWMYREFINALRADVRTAQLGDDWREYRVASSIHSSPHIQRDFPGEVWRASGQVIFDF